MYHVECYTFKLQNHGEGKCNYFDLVKQVEKEYEELDDSLKVKSVYKSEITKCDERSKCPKDCCHKMFRMNENQCALLGSEFDQPFLRYSCSEYDAKTQHNMTKKRNEIKKHINKFHDGKYVQFNWLKSLKPRKTTSLEL